MTLPHVPGDGQAGRGRAGSVARDTGERGAVGQKDGATALAEAAEQGTVEGVWEASAYLAAEADSA